MSRLPFLALALSSVALAGAAPNLVVVHTDEHNYRTLGCYRAVLPTKQATIWG